MTKKEEIALNILKYASKLSLQEPIMPEPDITALIGFNYPQLKNALGDFSSEDIMLLGKLETAGYLVGTFRDRVLLCPYCLAYNIIFRDTCPECGSPNIETLQMIHHYSCGYVGSEREFIRGDSLVCPKCSQILKHVGKDFEKPSEVYNCLVCNWSGSETATAGRCLACDAKIEQDNYIIYDIKSYIITPEGILAAKTGEISLDQGQKEKLPTKEELKNHTWSIFSLLNLANAFGMIGERYGMKLSGMSIFPNVVYDILNLNTNEQLKVNANFPSNPCIEKQTVIDEKISAFLNIILEKIKTIVRSCDYAAISEQATIFIIFPETSASQATLLAKRIMEAISNLSFSGLFKQTTLSIGISEWEKNYDATEFLQHAKIAMERARKNGGNQIELFKNEMAPN